MCRSIARGSRPSAFHRSPSCDFSTLPDNFLLFGPTQVVITGVGAVSPLGWGDDFWNGLVEGRSGIGRLPSWADDYPAKVSLDLS